MSDELSLQHFASHLRCRFRVAQSADCELELAEITDNSNAQLEQFSLVFIGAAFPWLQQGLYTLVDPEMREHQLFLVPIGPDAAGMRYEAAFSRFIREPEAIAGSL
jgi:hypothetical protein